MVSEIIMGNFNCNDLEDGIVTNIWNGITAF